MGNILNSKKTTENNKKQYNDKTENSHNIVSLYNFNKYKTNINPKYHHRNGSKNLVFIKSRYHQIQIPTLYIKNPDYKKIIIYSHQYNKDMNACLTILYHMHRSLSLNIISYNYPYYDEFTTTDENDENKTNDENDENNENKTNIPNDKNDINCGNDMANYETLSDVYYYLINDENYIPKNIILYGIDIGVFPTLRLSNILSISNEILLKNIIIQINNNILEIQYIDLLKSIKYPTTIIYTIDCIELYNDLVEKTSNLYRMVEIHVDKSLDLEITSPRKWLNAVHDAIK